MNREICVAVSTHKPYRMPSDPIYMPMQVGKALHPDTDLGEEFVPDNTGDNISMLNASYSELTALYWMWKNCDADFKGLVHYRRHFGTRNFIKRTFAHDRFDRIATHSDVLSLLKGDAQHPAIDIIVPVKRHYYIETIYSHYSHTLDASQLDKARQVLEILSPESVLEFDNQMNSRSAHMFNMFIMSRTCFDEYCTWLFPILNELDKRISSDSYDSFEARYPGRVSECLLDVWLSTKHYKYAELPVVSPEPINWWKKGAGFLKAKFIGKKYSKSF